MKLNNLQSAPSNNVVRSRIRLEQAGRDDISAQTLSALLTQCKSVQTTRELESLVQKYGVDLDTFRKITAFINTPSIDPATVIRTVNKDGKETQTMPVRDLTSPQTRTISHSKYPRRCGSSIAYSSNDP